MAHSQPSIAEARIRNLIGRLARLVLKPDPVVFTARFARSADPVAYAEREKLAYQPIAEDAKWGETWDSAWFHLTAEVPKTWAGEEVVARIDLGGEILVFDAAGCPLVGLTNGSVFEADYSKDIVHGLLPKAAGGEKLSLWCEAAANGLFGINTTDPEFELGVKPLHGSWTGTVKAIRLHRFDRALWQLWLDLQVLEDLMRGLGEGSPRRARLLRGLDRAVTAFERGGAAAAREELAPLWAVKADPGATRFTGVGHAHIDTAWLWPMRETVRKTARTFASQVGLIARYPGYVFGASQAQLYAFVKERYPALHAKVKATIASGGWEVQGGMWVEADCNVPSGESLIRQFVHGKRFFKAEYGVEPKNLWLPDVFGYSGQLPQILQQSGCPAFLTQKLSWNKYNKFPHNTFIWRGIDGSEVVAHFPPEDDYNSAVRPGRLIQAQERDRDKAVIGDAICLFGIGDGGGGPKEEHVERGRRLADLNGCPPFRFGPAQPVLERMAAHRAELDTWSGELYFECHRATYTTQAAMKLANRRAEEALRLAETLCAAAGPAAWPRAELDRLWKTVLTNQFHDIIPGSSIRKVYEDAVPEDQQVAARCRELAQQAATRLGRADAACCSWVNVSSTAFDDLVELPAGWTGARDAAGAALPAQAEGGRVLVRLQVPAQGFAVLRQGAGATAAASRCADDAGLVLENDLVRCRFDRGARLVEAFDKRTGRELMAAPGNDLAIYEDRPHCWDAWDIDEQYKATRLGGLAVQSIGRVDGPLRSALVVRGTIGGSPVTQEIRLARHSARLDFATDVDWKEQHKLLRVAFPTTVVAAEASCEMQYGFVRRPTHRNTSWDTARFEVCAHRWADISERSRGAALLNDGKYGYSVLSGELGLSLLRASTNPDPVADVGQHRFTYAFLPHAGDLPGSEVRAQAAALNQGVTALPGVDCAQAAFPVRLEGEGAELAVIKYGEDRDDLIVRVVETRGDRARVRLAAADARAEIVPTDLIEWHDGAPLGRGAVELDLPPFAIRTYRIRKA